MIDSVALAGVDVAGADLAGAPLAGAPLAGAPLAGVAAAGFVLGVAVAITYPWGRASFSDERFQRVSAARPRASVCASVLPSGDLREVNRQRGWRSPRAAIPPGAKPLPRI
ncbi:MAG: hypothetical protein EXQ88_06135 [Alphaproteobacteria bacterium]|nr:hypothetical protein [Alphaproteobacteria bacterium]